MSHFFIAILLPPASSFYISYNLFLKSCCLLFWAVSYYIFFYHSVVIGLALHLLLSICVIVIQTKKKKKQILSDKFDYLYLSILSFLVVSAVVNLSSIHIKYNTRIQNSIENDFELIDVVVLGRALFGQKCSVCHVITEENYVGPSLKGIYNRPAGKYKGYSYSKGLARVDFVWNKKYLTLYLENQNNLVPGTRMIISELPQEEIRSLVAYLETLD